MPNKLFKAMALLAVFLMLTLFAAPVMAASIPAQWETAVLPATITSITYPASITANPDNLPSVQSLPITCRVTTAAGQLDVANVSFTLTSSGVPQTTPIVVNARTQIDTNTADFVANIPISYLFTPGGNYKVTCVATTNENQATTQAGDYCTVNELMSLTVETPSIEFGALTYGQTSALAPVTFHNSGNKDFQTGPSTVPAWQSDGGGSSVPTTSLHAINHETSADTTCNAFHAVYGDVTTGTVKHIIDFKEVVPSTGLTLKGVYTTTVTLNASGL